MEKLEISEFLLAIIWSLHLSEDLWVAFVKVCDTPCFPTVLAKEDRFCDFLFDSQYNETILGKGLLLKDRISSCWGWGDLFDSQCNRFFC